MGRRRKREIVIRNQEIYLAWLGGESPAQIAERIGMTKTAVYAILSDQNQRDAEEIMLENMVSHERQLSQLQALLREALAGWTNSKDDSVTTRILTNEEGGQRAERVIKTRDGNPQFLDRALRIAMQLLAIQGSPISEEEDAEQRSLLYAFERHALLEDADGLALLTSVERRIARRNRDASQLRRGRQPRPLAAGESPFAVEPGAGEDPDGARAPADRADASSTRQERTRLEVLPGLVPGDESPPAGDSDQRDG